MRQGEMLPIVQAIVAHMPGWSVVPCDYDHAVKVGDEKGHVLFIHGARENGRLHVSGEYPRDKGNSCYGQSAVGYRGELPSITVDAKRPGNKLAADILRRLVPAYVEVYAKAVELKAKNDDYNARVEAQAKRLAAIVGVEPGPRDSREAKNVVSFYRSEGGYGTFKVYGDSVNVELNNLSYELAEKIVEFFRNAGKK